MQNGLVRQVFDVFHLMHLIFGWHVWCGISDVEERVSEESEPTLLIWTLILSVAVLRPFGSLKRITSPTSRLSYGVREGSDITTNAFPFIVGSIELPWVLKFKVMPKCGKRESRRMKIEVKMVSRNSAAVVMFRCRSKNG